MTLPRGLQLREALEGAASSTTARSCPRAAPPSVGGSPCQGAHQKKVPSAEPGRALRKITVAFAQHRLQVFLTLRRVVIARPCPYRAARNIWACGPSSSCISATCTDRLSSNPGAAAGLRGVVLPCR